MSLSIKLLNTIIFGNLISWILKGKYDIIFDLIWICQSSAILVRSISLLCRCTECVNSISQYINNVKRHLHIRLITQNFSAKFLRNSHKILFSHYELAIYLLLQLALIYFYVITKPISFRNFE